MEVERAVPLAKKPHFPRLRPHHEIQRRLVPVPFHRLKPLKDAWSGMKATVLEEMKIDMMMNTNVRKVVLETRPYTTDVSNLQKCADFVQAFIMGFDVKHAISLLRVDEMYVDSFEIRDVKTLRGEHLSRAIGRMCGYQGKTKFAIENDTMTRIVIADTKIHILGSYAQIKRARHALCCLILGSPAQKVLSSLRSVAARRRLAETW